MRGVWTHFNRPPEPQIALEKIRGTVEGLEGPHDEHFAARTLGVIKAKRKFLALIGRESAARVAAAQASTTDEDGGTSTTDAEESGGASA